MNNLRVLLVDDEPLLLESLEIILTLNGLNIVANGADGYLLKDSGKDAIIGAIGQIIGGRNVIDSKVMQRLAMLMGGKKPLPALPDGMTSCESEICMLLAQGFTNKQIAEALYISEGTVKNYISSIYDKTGIHDRAKLIVAIKG